jgi:hypothetical protein
MLDLLVQIILEVVAFMFSGVFTERRQAWVNEDVPGCVLRVVLTIRKTLAICSDLGRQWR